ncbi:MAG: ATP-dependent DNA helicase [Alphaproteobacteria bacterium]|nr:ATP-dependent DNA helicase [Alphaproteobacteria bacterium]
MPSAPVSIPAAPALVAGASAAVWLSPDGEIAELSLREAAARAREQPPLVVHGPAVARRLNCERFPAFDLLELFAFVRPAQFCLPTPRGLAQSLGLAIGHGLAAEAAALIDACRALLGDCAHIADPRARAIARAMAGAWRWGPSVLAAMNETAPSPGKLDGAAFAAWKAIAEWEDAGPPGAPRTLPVEPVEARARLVKLVGASAEPRPQQADYASAVSHAFLPRDLEDSPRLVLAEAGTGVGKTLGYIAPATVWAEKNGGAVWVSTYTRNLQTQIDRELDRLHTDPAEKAEKVVIRKGRENYLCLLNLEEAVGALVLRPHDAVALGLMSRWTAATRDGDIAGGDLPGWLPDLLGRARTRELADRRGECIYSACAHYRRCFIERSIRRARHADIVIANHALVMIQAALGSLAEGDLPTRYVFDEGHHVFSAADAAFSAILSGREAAELRRWLIGADGTRTRARGLRSRAGELCAGDGDAEKLLDTILRNARALPSEGWPSRVENGNASGPTEAFLALVRRQVLARASDVDDGFSLECEPRPPVPDLVEAADALEHALAGLEQPMTSLAKHLSARLDKEASELDTTTRSRIEAVARSLKRRTLELVAWRGMLKALASETPAEFVDWFQVDRIEGRELDVGFHRHWVDPTVPFATVVARPAHGVLITSATLTDARGAAPGSEDTDAAWQAAEARTGAVHLPDTMRASVPSPFDYPKQTRVLVVTDVKRDDIAQVAAAYRELFVAAGGGALGLFTAIHRLRAVHGRIARPLEAAGIPLFAQHVDGLETSMLVDIFRGEEDSCLLGTDAVRDGVDVPGRSLRLIVFDRVPWPRPDILHKARKAAFGGAAYDDMIVRLRLKQAFGRLVRRADDTGVFVLLDSRLPSRLATAFPEGVAPQRVGLAEAVATVRAFLAPLQAPTDA